MDKVRRNRVAFIGLMAANLVGIAYGYYYYWEVGQFDPSSRYFREYGWWLFIPDSPNAVVLMSASLVLERFGIRSRLLDSLAFVAMVYVGLWTTALFLLFPDQLGTFAWDRFPENANPLLFVSHMGMPLEALLLLPSLRRLRPSRAMVYGVLAWSIANLWLDYGPVHLHPAPFVDGHADLHSWSMGIMLATLALWATVVLGRARQKRGLSS